MFATDRDLLVLEPRLFDLVAWTGQRLLSSPDGGEIDSSGATLTVPGADFESLGVDAGHVARINGVAAEVIERTNPQTLTISLIRASADDAPIPLSPVSDAKVEIATFRPQIQLIHDQLMSALGIGIAQETEEQITNGDELRRVEALGALHLIFAAASALSGEAAPFRSRAISYEARFRIERRRASALLDLDGDGKADARRRLDLIPLVRG